MESSRADSTSPLPTQVHGAGVVSPLPPPAYAGTAPSGMNPAPQYEHYTEHAGCCSNRHPAGQ
ncbi:hypothetical protein YT1_0349 [Rhodococcus ruber]|nr:hypothetical protein YT1_0349 [Rhodococcus ruber]